MGFLKDFKTTMNSASEVAQAATEMVQAQTAAHQQAAAPDLNDPAFAPIEGISLDQYAQITAGLMKNTVTGIEAVKAHVESQGVAPGTWEAVNLGWTQRMAQNAGVRNRYGVLYQQGLA